MCRFPLYTLRETLVSRQNLGQAFLKACRGIGGSAPKVFALAGNRKYKIIVDLSLTYSFTLYTLRETLVSRYKVFCPAFLKKSGQGLGGGAPKVLERGYMEDRVLIIKYGEIAMRGKNRSILEDRIIKSIRRNVDPYGRFFVRREQGRFVLEDLGGEMDFDLVIPKVCPIFGLLGVSPATRTDDQSMENFKRLALEEIRNAAGDAEKTFKIVTRRGDKSYPLTSHEVSADIGEYILNEMPALRVDVHNPEITVTVEIRTHGYVYSRDYRGWGGLPYASSGSAVALLSGGIDSPVAAWMMAKRGVRVHGAYFHSPPYTSERARDKVLDLGKQIAFYTGEFTLYTVPFTDVQLYLLENVPKDKLTIFLKRAMTRAAEQIAVSLNAQGLITGDSVGQVASQTMKAIQCINAAAALPVYRPLAGMDKQEIIDLAVKIGTFDISSRPYEDCCTIFVAKHPELGPKLSVIERIEANLPLLADKIEKAVENTEITVL